MQRFVSGLVGGVVGVVVGALIVLGYLQLIPDLWSGQNLAGSASGKPLAPAPTRATPSPPGGDVRLADEERFADVYQQIIPSVVYIAVKVNTPLGDKHPDDGGSGFFVDDEGHVLTNNHVVATGERLEVELADGTRAPARIVGRDVSHDLAVLRIDAPKEKMPAAPLGDSARLRVGQLALAIGSPFGHQRSLTLGVISALGRYFASDEGGRPIPNMIQTDTVINPGSSGGPLLNTRGEVIGINTAIENPTGAPVFVGVGFALPINTAKDRLAEMIGGKTLIPAWLGVSGQAITAPAGGDPDIPTNKGVLITEVLPGGPAMMAGLKPADVLTKVDQTEVRSIEEVIAYLDSKRPGDSLTLSLVRDGKATRLPVTLGEWPAEQR